MSKTLRLGHSPDPDDAFMWWPLANFETPDGTRFCPVIDTHGYEFVHVLEDIESLNQRSAKGELEITALSIHQYPYVAEHYALTTCGSSMGDGYGPMIVTRSDGSEPTSPEQLKGKRLAIPGYRTSAWLTCQLLLDAHGLSANDVEHAFVMFDEIPEAVAKGEFDAGLLIHEGQLTYRESGLTLLTDLGAWWKQETGLPLPLGGNAIRRDIGDAMPTVCRVLLDSIEYALTHRDEALDFALRWARGMGVDLADRFVGMYVNDVTLDYGERGREAVSTLLCQAQSKGLIPEMGEVSFVEPADK